jgi:hypothetical protein
MSFEGKITFYVDCAKNIKNYPINSHLGASKFIFLQEHKKIQKTYVRT